MRTWRVALVLVAFVAFQIWWFGRETPTERRLAAVASGIAKAEVAVRCPSIWRRLIEVSSFDGTAHWSADGRPTHAELRHHVCATFDRLAERGFPADVSCLAAADAAGAARCDEWVLDVARAVHVLSHESWHLAGVFDEPTTECYAYQTDAEVAVRFGATAAAGNAIGRYFLRIGPRHALPQYRPSSDCRRGGRQDLRPATPGWPSS